MSQEFKEMIIEKILIERKMEIRRIFNSFCIKILTSESFKSAENTWRKYEKSFHFATKESSIFSSTNFIEAFLNEFTQINITIRTGYMNFKKEKERIEKLIEMRNENKEELINRLSNLNQILNMEQKAFESQVRKYILINSQ